VYNPGTKAGHQVMRIERSMPTWREHAMIDAMTRKPLSVSNLGTAGPYIMVPFSQLSEVRQLLHHHNVRYSVEEDVISLDGAPEIAVVNFGRGADAAAIQAILDNAR
jgi:hypothetical protein